MADTVQSLVASLRDGRRLLDRYMSECDDTDEQAGVAFQLIRIVQDARQLMGPDRWMLVVRPFPAEVTEDLLVDETRAARFTLSLHGWITE
jgi:hypothetical protein